jgi:hypothetical protein
MLKNGPTDPIAPVVFGAVFLGKKADRSDQWFQTWRYSETCLRASVNISIVVLDAERVLQFKRFIV